MADDKTSTLTATFRTREEADLAVEHLVQQHGISRPDIFIQSSSRRNTTGTAPSRGDLERMDAPHQGEIEISVDIADGKISSVQRSLGDAGAIHISGR
jgi:hypothetical protein